MVRSRRIKEKVTVVEKIATPLPLSVPHLMRERSVLLFVPISRAELWKRVREGRFPAPVKLSPKVSAWRSGDIAAVLESWGVSCGEAA